MSNSSAYAAACLSVGLASAWAPTQAEGAVFSEVRIDTNLDSDVSHARLMLCGSGGGWDFVSLASLTYIDTFTFQSELEVDPTGTSYAMMGLMDNGSGGLRLVVSHPGLTILNGSLFESVFPGYSEQVLIDMLLNDNPQADSFLMTYASMLGQRSGSSASATGFSVGEDVGDLTVTWTAVPAPSAALLLPVWAAASRRRRR